MGEIADLMINGDTCSWCGLFFKDSHGYPVVCIDCFKGWSDENNKGADYLLSKLGLQIATEEIM